jgi:hypothetical protein
MGISCVLLGLSVACCLQVQHNETWGAVSHLLLGRFHAAMVQAFITFS